MTVRGQDIRRLVGVKFHYRSDPEFVLKVIAIKATGAGDNDWSVELSNFDYPFSAVVYVKVPALEFLDKWVKIPEVVVSPGATRRGASTEPKAESKE